MFEMGELSTYIYVEMVWGELEVGGGGGGEGEFILPFMQFTTQHSEN